MGMILRGIGMKSCKKWLLLFGGVLLAGLVAIAALVIYVDPFSNIINRCLFSI